MALPGMTLPCPRPLSAAPIATRKLQRKRIPAATRITRRAQGDVYFVAGGDHQYSS
jgi:hypothetical protein